MIVLPWITSMDSLSFLHWFRDIYRRYFLRNIPIISLTDYKEKISWEKNLTKSVANIWDCTGRFRKVIRTLICPFSKFELWFCKLNLWFRNLEMICNVISQLGGDFATWFAAAKMEFQLAKWHTCAWRWFRSCETPCEIFASGFHFAAHFAAAKWALCCEIFATKGWFCSCEIIA